MSANIPKKCTDGLHVSPLHVSTAGKTQMKIGHRKKILNFCLDK